MFNQIFIVAALALYLFLVIRSVVIGKRGVSMTSENYSRGDGNYSAFVIAFAMAATMVGPADILALSQNGLKYGLIWACFPLGAALAQLVTGCFFANSIKSRYPLVESIGDVFKQECGPSTAFAAGVIAFIQSIAFSGVLILAGGQILNTFLGIPKEFGMIITCVVVAGYTAIGGMNTVMRNDKFDGWLMGGMLFLIFISSLVFTFRNDINFSDVLIKKPDFSNDYDFKLIASMFMGYFLGEMLLPTYFVRASISQSPRSASRGFIFTSLFLFLWYIVITYGGAITSFIPAESRHVEANFIFVDLISQLVGHNRILLSIIGAGCFLVFLSLINSTFDAFLHNGSVSFSRDIVGAFSKFDSNQSLWISRRATLGIAALGLFVAIWKNDLIDILFLGYTVWVPTILAPLLWILGSRKKLSATVFWIGFFIGCGTWILFEYIVKSVPIPSILIGLVCNFIAIAIVQSIKKSV